MGSIITSEMLAKPYTYTSAFNDMIVLKAYGAGGRCQWQRRDRKVDDSEPSPRGVAFLVTFLVLLESGCQYEVLEPRCRRLR